METTKEGFNEKLSLVMKIPGVERVQVDFGDGDFIPAKLLPPSEIDVLNPALHWEAHLMCKEPKDFLDYQICGFRTLLIHYEAFKNADDVKAALSNIRTLNLKAGLVFNPDTPISVANDFAGLADLFLIMGVVPGKQGQAFIEKTLERIAELRKLLPNAIIEVDGGVNAQNIKAISEAGADLIVVGSALVKVADVNLAYERLAAEIGRN